MKIHVAESAGFCFGVKRAIDIACKTLAAGHEVCALGDIVHNEDVAQKLKSAGLKKVKNLACGKDKIFLIQAHGASLAVIEKARRLGYDIVNATCPMVKEIHEIACRSEKEGCQIIVVGDKEHDEVRGIIGQLKKKALVITDSNCIPWDEIKRIKKAAVVVQSTQNIESVNTIVDLLKRHIKECRFFDTICRPTRLKQKEMKSLPLENDVMVIIGSKNSANTKRLYEISKSLNPRTHWVQSKKNIKPGWFRKAKTVGVTAGASTPAETIEDIVAQLKQIA